MTFSEHRIDLAACRAAGHAPHDVVVRARPGDIWLVAAGPLTAPGLRWTRVAAGDFVLVPAFSYTTIDRDPMRALAFAAQLGALAAGGVARPRRVHLACGDVLEAAEADDGTPVFRFHLGVAVQVDE